MNTRIGLLCAACLIGAVSLSAPSNAAQRDEISALQDQVANLTLQLQAVQAELQQLHQQGASNVAFEDLAAEVRKTQSAQDEWKEATSVVHLAGYGSTNYSDSDGTKGEFDQAQFSPIFHYLHDDLMMLESELEITIDDEGETETVLEYLALDLFLNDYMTLVAGKFLSPIGQFSQNFHPSWINKLPSEPVGFGHDGAAPASDVGVELRGGFPLGGMHANYAVYVANGPTLMAINEDGMVELEGIEADGSARDADGSKVYGGRFALLPLPNLEIGVSGATGETTVTEIEDEEAGTAEEWSGDTERDYRVYGGDFVWQLGGAEFRGEYVRSDIGDAVSSIAPEGARWTAWYVQSAYQFLPTKWEGVLRYADFDSPHATEDQTQWALGLNYRFAPNVLTKIAYEWNDGQNRQLSDRDRLLLQMAYGF